MKYYVDTCIWRDYWEDRTDKLRPLGEFALNFFNKLIKNEDTIIVSDLVINELHVSYNKSLIYEILAVIPKELVFEVSYSKAQVYRAKILCKNTRIPFNDALHIIIAEDNDAILVSRDAHMIDFGEAAKPEDL